MPTRFEISDMVMYSVDGTPFRLGNIKDVTTFDPGDPEGDQVAITFAQPKEYTATMTIHGNIRRILNKILYGWKASGPVRKRVLERQWRRKYKGAR